MVVVALPEPQVDDQMLDPIATASTCTEWVRNPLPGNVGVVDVGTLAEPVISVPSGSNSGHTPSVRGTTPGMTSSAFLARIRILPLGL